MAMSTTTPAPWYGIQPRSVKPRVVKEAPKLYENPTLQKIYETVIFNRPFWFALGLPIFLVYISWLALTIQYDLWYLAEDGWKMSITMIFGAFVAGSTTLGGGAVAFPVMVLVLQASPPQGRDFSLLIQSIGMVAAAWNILYSRVLVDMTALLWCSIGGFLGVIIGFQAVVPAITEPIYVTFFFVAFWMSFSVSLFIHNRNIGRPVFKEIQNADIVTKIVLMAVGIIGGIASAMTGSGVDICCFAVLTTLYSLAESVATPTSVCLMGLNTVIATVFRATAYGPLEDIAKEFVWFSVPIVVVMAPVGAYVASYLHRQMLAVWVYLLTFVQVVSAFAVLTYESAVVEFAVGIFFGGVALWLAFAYFGTRRLEADVPSTKTDKNVDMDQQQKAPLSPKTEAKSGNEDIPDIEGQKPEAATENATSEEAATNQAAAAEAATDVAAQ